VRFLRRHQGIEASRHRAEEGKKKRKHPQITQIFLRGFLRGMQREEFIWIYRMDMDR